MNKARPKAAPQAQKLSRSARNAMALKDKLLIHSPKCAEDFGGAAVKLAAELGWEGDGEWELNGIQVKAAQRFLCKSMHEIHQAAHNADRQAPSAESICTYLGISDTEGTDAVKDFVASLLESELKGAEESAQKVMN